MTPTREQVLRSLTDACADFYVRGWMLATGGNASARFGQGQFLISASGRHKGRLQEEDFLAVGLDGKHDPPDLRPSAETLVHLDVYRRCGAGAVVHVHTPFATIVSRRFLDRGSVRFSGLEMLKGLDHWEPDAVVEVPVIPNHHGIPMLGEAVSAHTFGPCPAVLIAGHGIYAWGHGVVEAQGHAEALEFCCEAWWRDRQVR